jgi:hypothetical protein
LRGRERVGLTLCGEPRLEALTQGGIAGTHSLQEGLALGPRQVGGGLEQGFFTFWF